MSSNLWAQMSVGQRLRQAIIERFPSLAAFCRETGMPYRTLQEYLADNRSPGADALTLCAKAQIDINWILTGEGGNEVAEYRATYDAADPRLHRIREWILLWWSQADEEQRVWFDIQLRRTFPEYRKS